VSDANGQRPETEEARFAALLSAYHESLLPEPVAHSNGADATGALVAAAACVELLERFRRGENGPDAEGDTPLVVGVTMPSPVPDMPGANGDQWDGGRPLPPLGRLGRFEIRRELGRGGQGIVFLAFDPALDREVALKIPRPEVLFTEDLRRRFLREGKAAAILDHPNLVPVYEAGQAGPICYIASAYAPGLTLADWLARRSTAVPARTAAALVATLSEAVEYMHNRNVLHRDLKPANVLLDPESCDVADARAMIPEAWASRARLTDFGLARPLESLSSQSHSAVLAGTPAYIAPEQVTPGASELGRHTDVYGLGVILYETLTGRPPIQGETLADTLFQVLTEEPPSPRSAKHARWTPDVPRDLETVCLKAISKEPQARYATAGELAADLRRFLAGMPVRARPVGLFGSLWRWGRRRPLVAALSTAVALSIVSGVVAVFCQWQRAEAHREEAEANLRETRGVVERYFTRISENVLLDEPTLQPLRRELLADSVDYYRSFIAKHGNDPELREDLAAAYFRLGSLTWEIGSAQEARTAHEAALRLRRQLLSERPNDPQLRRSLAESCYDLGILTREGGNSAEALRLHEEARQLRESVLKAVPDDAALQRDLGWSCNNIGLAASELGHTQTALNAYRQAETNFQQLIALDPQNEQYRGDLAVTLNRYGLLYKSLDRCSDALRLHARALQILQADGDPRSLPDPLGRVQAATHRHIGDAWRVLHPQNPQGVHAYEQAVHFGTELVHDHPAVIRYRGELGEALFGLGQARQSLGQLDAALDAYRRACEVWEQVVATSLNVPVYEIRLVRAHHYAGDALRLLKRPAETVPHFQRACEVGESLVARHPENRDYQMELGAVSFSLGYARESVGESEGAVASLERARNVFQRLLDCTGDKVTYQSWYDAANDALTRLRAPHEAGS
jgi:serine/threonine protein kinase